jgi:hypothetical protein
LIVIAASAAIDVGMPAEKQRAELLGQAAQTKLKDMNDLDRQLSGTEEAREPSSDGLINLDHNDFKSIKIAVP